MTTHADIPLLLFAKAPIAGKVKTRLSTHCTAQQAANIAKILIQASIEKALAAWPGQVLLSVWLDQDHPFFQEMVARYPIKMVLQCEGDLGQKMRHALANCGYPAAVMGCDAPHIATTALVAAHRLLSEERAVIGPSDDGGYYLLGLSDDADELFADMPWGGAQVLPKTLESAKRIGLELNTLAPLNDVDEWGDLIAMANLVPPLLDYLVTDKLINAR